MISVLLLCIAIAVIQMHAVELQTYDRFLDDGCCFITNYYFCLQLYCYLRQVDSVFIERNKLITTVIHQQRTQISVQRTWGKGSPGEPPLQCASFPLRLQRKPPKSALILVLKVEGTLPFWDSFIEEGLLHRRNLVLIEQCLFP